MTIANGLSQIGWQEAELQAILGRVGYPHWGSPGLLVLGLKSTQNQATTRVRSECALRIAPKNNIMTQNPPLRNPPKAFGMYQTHLKSEESSCVNSPKRGRSTGAGHMGNTNISIDGFLILEKMISRHPDMADLIGYQGGLTYTVWKLQQKIFIHIFLTYLRER